MTAALPLAKVQNLQRLYPVERGLFRQAHSFVHAVDGVSFEIAAGESLGLVGESGCGKTTTGKMLVKLIEPSSGSLQLRIGENVVDVAGLRGSALRNFRRNVQMVFQDPYESMNPRMTVYDIVSEPLAVQAMGTVAERERRVAEFLDLVGLTPPSSFLFRYTHELSGGQRQRVAIARALVLEPAFVVADEPTSMLDVSIRTGVMHLMQDLAQRLNVTYLYITHDLAVARYMCDRIAVMYLGKIVEIGPTEEILQCPRHPYTQALLSAVPIPDPRVRREAVQIKGGVSKPIDPQPRCRFYERCLLADDYCREQQHPPLVAATAGSSSSQ
ncbi:MAG: ATP-binding cassette domain-containing protein [Anaerolineales bacterium]|nr:ATP-binding cassette domain-containing protein [Anaerolineales bacterium]